MFTRRHFFQTATTAALTATTVAHSLAQSSGSATSAAPRPISKAQRAHKKGFMMATLRGPTAEKLTVLDRFKLLADAGFHGVELMSAMDRKEVLDARSAAGLEIPSVVVATHWAKPLSEPSEEIRAVGLEGLRHALRDAHAYGAKSVLLVPGKVTKTVSYADAYRRSRDEIAKALPLAASLGVIIAIENVWNQFLLSPLEAVSYVDSFNSPWVKWHFDAGNVINFGYPEDWIRTLRERIVQVHVKEFNRKQRDTRGPYAGFEADLFDGDADWPAVMAALDEIGYSGWIIAEQWRPPGMEDGAWLKHLSRKLDALIAA